MSNSWVPFDSYREMKIIENKKILVIRPSDQTTVVPLFCSVCKFPMQNSFDSLAFRKKGCCGKCLEFCQGDRTLISPEIWEEYLHDRHLFAKPLLNFK
jgi:hypothetical protein